MSDSKETSGKCSKCRKKTSIPSEIKPEDALCTKCMNDLLENQRDYTDSFDFDQGYNIEEVYDQ